MALLPVPPLSITNIPFTNQLSEEIKRLEDEVFRTMSIDSALLNTSSNTSASYQINRTVPRSWNTSNVTLSSTPSSTFFSAKDLNLVNYKSHKPTLYQQCMMSQPYSAPNPFETIDWDSSDYKKEIPFYTHTFKTDSPIPDGKYITAPNEMVRVKDKVICVEFYPQTEQEWSVYNRMAPKMVERYEECVLTRIGHVLARDHLAKPPEPPIPPSPQLELF